MEKRISTMENTCDFASVRPIMLDLPYPSVKVREKNLAYANLLSFDYCGAVSEMSAITQYINNENRLSCEKCPIAKTILGIAMAEMIHLQKLGEMIVLLGGNISFTAKMNNGKQRMWTPKYLTLPDNAEQILRVSIESEEAAILQYKKHMQMIRDPYINAVLERIIRDEEYHIMILQVLMKDL
ncbi:MAG: ferritin family protein [Lachnospiraceae bacterium]|nr:ferritin family protein [Lachnospiraceae bacterium]